MLYLSLGYGYAVFITRGWVCCMCVRGCVSYRSCRAVRRSAGAGRVQKMWRVLWERLPRWGGEAITLQCGFSYLFRPLLWLIGIPGPELATAADLMATKTVLNEFVAYLDLARLPADALSAHSRLVLTYALCGFANFGSLGILVGGLGAMVPERKHEIVGLGLRSIVSGTLATLMSGAVAGMLLADFGAEVVKVEQPVSGDPLRQWTAGGRALWWKVYARNKRFVTLNLKTPEGRDLLPLVALAQRRNSSPHRVESEVGIIRRSLVARSGPVESVGGLASATGRAESFSRIAIGTDGAGRRHASHDLARTAEAPQPQGGRPRDVVSPRAAGLVS